ncbi:hypothetical protein HaLaN_02665 [Haematococcus lacustris]|uniref:Uncharacterized protein n=1 Tax=Haematococcus lacustris TaxID=44745 RepID=A0A699YEN2_HAELA|nr:hypothetical protein HaLaN_02665 [Haematococcus lacustris]
MLQLPDTAKQLGVTAQHAACPSQGYVMTIRHHTSLGLHLAGHLARLAVKGGLKLGRWAVGAGVLLRKLAARGLITP